MFGTIHFLVAVVLIGFALSIIYPHGHWIWLKHIKYGYKGALTMRWKLAWKPLLFGTFIVAIALGLELYAGIQQQRELENLNNRLQAIDISQQETNEELQLLIDSIDKLLQNNMGNSTR